MSFRFVELSHNIYIVYVQSCKCYVLFTTQKDVRDALIFILVLNVVHINAFKRNIFKKSFLIFYIII